jgi:arylformamidase
METSSPAAAVQIGPYRVVCLSKIVDPDTERRRCNLNRRMNMMEGYKDFQTDLDIVTHLGTHVEAPCHHGELTKDVVDLMPERFIGRGVVLHLDTCGPRALVRRDDLEAADGGRVQPNDVVLLTSNYRSEPFVVDPNDERPHLGLEAGEWFADKQVKGIGFGDGISVERDDKEAMMLHEHLLSRDIVILEVLQNIGLIERQPFLFMYLPLPIKGLDSSPVNAVALEGVPGFCE